MIPLDTQFNLFFQNLGIWLLPIMQFFSFLGTEGFYYIAFPAIYWCFDTGLGIRLVIVLLSSSLFNGVFKLAFHLPRPYWVDAKVIPYSAESSFGFPSGHSQKAASAWGMLGYSRHKKWAAYTAAFIILMIGISRLYLGMHFSSDVLAGWLFGFIILWLAVRLDKPVSQWISRTSPLVVFLVATGITSLLMGVGVYFYLSLLPFQIPENWVMLASRGGSSIDPASIKDLFTYCGIWWGFIGGACWLRSLETRIGKFVVSGSPKQKVGRFVLGVTGILGIWTGLGLFFPHTETVAGLTLRLLHYGLIGAWISGLAPYVFFKIGLAVPEKSAEVSSSTTL